MRRDRSLELRHNCMVMPVSTPDALFDALHYSRLVPPAELAAVREEFSGDDRPPLEIAEQLVLRRLVTAWQAQRLLVGQTAFFLGKYKLLAKLGEGGMGAVFKAEQAPIGRIVAVKVLPQRLVKEPAALGRFRREIQTAAALQHPNIVVAYDADSVRDTHFLVMEYVDGEDLAALLKRRGRLPLGEACEYIRQAALGLEHAHARGMAHRDIKPSNLMVKAERGGTKPDGDRGRPPRSPQDGDHAAPLHPVVKILDFGLARFTSEFGENGQLTRTGEIVGTPDYISPEQAVDTRTADIRSDIYSLGCTLYRLLSGELPFPGRSVMEKLMSRVSRDPIPLGTRCPDLPDQLAAVVHRMLAREPDDRYQTPAEVVAALAPFASSRWEGPSGPKRSAATIDRAALADSARPERALVLDDPTFPGSEGTASFLASLANEASVDSDTSRTTGSGTLSYVEPPGAAVASDPDAASVRVTPATKRTAARAGSPLPSTVVWRRAAERRRWIISLCLAAVVTGLLLAWVVYTLTGSTLLVIDWPEGERERATLTVDGRRAELPERGPLRFSGTWGARSLRLTREGYAPIAETLTLARGETRVYEVRWQPLPATARRLKLAALRDQAAALNRRLAGHPPPASDTEHLELQQRIIDFRRRHAVHAESLQAAALAMTIPCAADRLDASKLPDWERPMLARAVPADGPGAVVAVLGDARLRHVGLARGLAWSPDGRLLATGASDGALRLWNPETGAMVEPARDSPGLAHALAWSPDGRLLACAGGTVRVWEVGAAEPVHDFPNEGSHYISAAFSPDGRWLAAGTYQAARVWDLATGDVVQTIATRHNTGVAFHPHDGTLVAVTGNVAQLWDVAGNRLVREFSGDNYPAFSPDGRRLALSHSEGDVLIVDLATGELEHRLPGHSRWTRPVFDRHSRLVAAASGSSVKLWSVEDGSFLRQIDGFRGDVQSVEFRPDGTALAATDSSGAVTLWDVETSQRLVETGPSITTAAASPDGRHLAAGHEDGAVVLYDLATAEPVRTLARHDGPVAALAFHPDGRRLASADDDGPLEIWDAATGRPVHQFAETLRMTSLFFSPDGKLLVAGEHPHSLSAWETARWRRHRFPDTIPMLLTVTAAAFTPDGERLATASTQQQAHLWSLASGQLAWHRDELSEPRQLVFSPDGRLLTVVEASRMSLWEVAGKKDPLVPNDSGGFTSLSFRPDGRLLVAGRPNGQIFQWSLPDAEGPTWVLHFGAPHTVLRDVAFTPDGRHVMCVPGHGAAYILRLQAWPPAGTVSPAP